MVRCTVLFALVLSSSACTEQDSPSTFLVTARAETAPSAGDPDDIAIWPNSKDPSQSLIVGTDKTGSIMLYELDGTLRQELRDGRMNNVDLRTDVQLGGEWGIGTLIATSNRSDDTIDLYTINPKSRMLVRLAAVPSEIGEPYGLCIFRSLIDGRAYVYVDDELGSLAQYQLLPSDFGPPTLVRRRTLVFDTTLEGCVADDEFGRLYLGEEDLGIWRLDAEPSSADVPVLIQAVADPHSRLAAEVEGLTIYRAAEGAGYLIASSQGSSTYVIFERDGDNDYVTSFRIVAGNLDAAVETDGIDVINLPLGPMWPNGLFIAHDDHNEGFSRNFKLVDWGDLAVAADVELLVDTEFGAAK